MDGISLRERVWRIARARFECGEPLSVNVVSEFLEVSRFSLIRWFQEELGSSPSAYLRELQYRRARQLLDSDELTVDQVAMLSGCGCTRTLTRIFFERHRMTVVEWRNRMQSAS